MKIFVSILAFLIVSCNNADHNKTELPFFDSLKVYFPDSTNKDVSRFEVPNYLRKLNISNSSGLSTMENGYNTNFELRFWIRPTKSNPQEMYILKRHKLFWDITRYLFYLRKGANTNSWTNPRVDSAVSEKRILKSGLVKELDTKYIQKLWSYLSQSELLNHNQFSFVDSSSVVIELGDRGKYKYISYSFPKKSIPDDSVFHNIDFIEQNLLKFFNSRQ